ncbi:MAG: hypothetical protein VYD87_16425 [Pseudomonadota bacterium]|nr:hypothetical protein [Pseudomonadota bacterium]MEE3099568.1 hypothetical protein [Pseudomonadota bacterium]
MLRLRVIAPGGAKLSGPAVLALTAEQAAARAHLLAPAKRKGRWALDGDTAFKLGEVIGIEAAPDKISLAQFEAADEATALMLSPPVEPDSPPVEPGPEGAGGEGSDDDEGEGS